MKMKDVISGMNVIVSGRSGTVDVLQLNRVIVKFDDGTDESFTYDKLNPSSTEDIKTTNMKIAILDIETTGFLQAGGKIVEIGIVELCLETGNKQIIFDSLCRERNMTQEEIERSWIVNNSDLTAEAVMNAPYLDEIAPDVQRILDEYSDGATAFNNAFDFGFMEDRGFRFNKKLGCPMKISTPICKLPKQKGFGFKWPNVMEAHRFFFGNVGYVEKHRGADDAFHEADIVFELYKRGEFLLN